MTALPKAKDLSKYPFEVSLEACPSELLKTVESLKDMGMTSTVFELSFRTINELEIFARILNREEDQERVANELKVTYFHNVRGKIKRTEMVKNEEFQTMKKVRFNSTYHVTLFLKYYQDRIKQLENEYRYTITSGREGYLYVYLNDDENISSMFINEIRDMKKRLNFLEIKDIQLCERFTYSEMLGGELKKIGLFHEIWYRGKQSTMIFYSEKQSLSKMKHLIHDVTRYHITILKMTDHRFPFLVNYFLFQLLKKLFWPEVRKLESVEMNQVQFNENKVGVVLHDMHEVFSAEIKHEILEKMKNFVLISYRAKFARGFFNYLKKNYYFDESLNFSYSKKTVCICINLEKVKSYGDLKKIFNTIGQSINFRSQITLNWLHLQDYSLYEYRKQLAQRIISILSSSHFYVQNYEKLALNKDLKCVIKLKNATIDNRTITEYVSETMAKCIAAWKTRQIGAKVVQNQVPKDQVQPQLYKLDQNFEHEEVQDESDSDQSQYDEQEANTEVNTQATQSTQQNNESKPTSEQKKIEPIRRGFQEQNNFTESLITFMKENDAKYFEPQSEEELEWKIAKSWRKLEDQLLTETKIFSKIKKLLLNQQLKGKIDSVLQKIRSSESVYLFFHNFDSYSPNMYESPFYKEAHEDRITTFNDFKAGQKFVICCQMEQNKTLVSYPLCSFEVMKRF